MRLVKLLRQAALGLFGAVVPIAQLVAQGADPATHPGTFVVAGNQQIELAVHGGPAAECAALALADQLVAVLRRVPSLASPVGFNAVISRATGSAPPPFDAGMPFHAAALGKLTYFDVEQSASGKPVFTDHGGSFPIAIYANMAACEERSTIDDAKELDGGPPVIAGYRLTGEFRGHPVYNGECVVISAGTEPVFTPVTMERYLRLAVLKMRAKQASNGQIGAQAAALEAQIAAMSPADRAKQASVLNEGDLMPADASSDDALSLMQPNTALFAGRGAPERAHTVVVAIPGLQPEIPTRRYEMNEQRQRDVVRIKAQLDWTALEGMVRP